MAASAAEIIEADDLVNASLPAGAIAFELPERDQDPKLVAAANIAYTCLIPRAAGPEAMLEALGLKRMAAELWPSAKSQEEARTVMGNLGWNPAMTLAVLVGHPSVLEDPTFHVSLAEAISDGWTLVGIGGRGTYQSLETLLAPQEDRAVNFAGVLSLASIAALLQICGGFLGGGPLLQGLASACGCAPFPRNRLTDARV